MNASDNIVCFDLGGVLVKIRHSWDAAIEAVGIEPQSKHRLQLNDSPNFLVYQDGLLGEEEYLNRLAGWLGSSAEDAAKVHGAILVEDYPGASELVRELRANGVFTCCFSNTNVLHWVRLCDPSLHPAVASLDAQFASHEIQLSKPARRAFEAVEAQMPAHKKVIFFDDSKVNVEAALECGWQAIRVDPFADPVGSMRACLDRLGLFARLGQGG